MIEPTIGEAGRGTLDFRIQPRITRGSAVQGAERSALVKHARPHHGRGNACGASDITGVAQNPESILLMIGFHKNSQKLKPQKIRSINTVTELIQFFIHSPAKMPDLKMFHLHAAAGVGFGWLRSLHLLGWRRVQPEGRA